MPSTTNAWLADKKGMQGKAQPLLPCLTPSCTPSLPRSQPCSLHSAGRWTRRPQLLLSSINPAPARRRTCRGELLLVPRGQVQQQGRALLHRHHAQRGRGSAPRGGGRQAHAAYHRADGYAAHLWDKPSQGSGGGARGRTCKRVGETAVGHAACTASAAPAVLHRRHAALIAGQDPQSLNRFLISNPNNPPAGGAAPTCAPSCTLHRMTVLSSEPDSRWRPLRDHDTEVTAPLGEHRGRGHREGATGIELGRPALLGVSWSTTTVSPYPMAWTVPMIQQLPRPVVKSAERCRADCVGLVVSSAPSPGHNLVQHFTAPAQHTHSCPVSTEATPLVSKSHSTTWPSLVPAAGRVRGKGVLEGQQDGTGPRNCSWVRGPHSQAKIVPLRLKAMQSATPCCRYSSMISGSSTL